MRDWKMDCSIDDTESVILFIFVNKNSKYLHKPELKFLLYNSGSSLN